MTSNDEPDGDDADLRRQLESALSYQELWRAVLRTATDPIIVIDSQGIIQRANPAAEMLFGYSRAELVGNNISMLMPEPYRSAHDGYLEAYATTGEAHIIGIGREVEARKADGSIFPIHLAVSDLTHDGETLYTGIIHDLSEIKHREAELVELNGALEGRVIDRTRELERSMTELSRSNRDLEQFAYIASHDLQTPLRNVRQGMELLNEHLTASSGQGFDDEALELQELTVGAITRMEELIRGLLSYSRVDRHDALPEQAVDLAQLVDQLFVDLRLELADQNATVSRDDLPVVSGDEVQLRQVMQNLIQNALKYRSEEQPPAVRVGSVIDNGWVVISVSDNGIGIDEDQHDRIFELFRRAHPGYDGVGLGLAICQRIVERHGGNIWVESTAGSGATFSFRLPNESTSNAPARSSEIGEDS